MAKFTASFDYNGKAPTDSFMENFVKNDAGYSNATKQSTVTWKITTSDKKSNVEQNLTTTIENHGKYTAGNLTSVDVT